LLHAAEGADANAPVGLAAPRAAPVLEAQELLGRLLDEGLHGVLVAQPVTAGDRVVAVLVEAVVVADHTRGAALGRDRVAAHRVDLGHHGDTEPGVGLGDGDGGTQARAAPADQDYVVGSYHLDSAVELIDEDVSIVARDLQGDGAVVVLVPDALAAAGVECFVGDQAPLLLILVLKALPIDELPTGSFLVREASARGRRHRLASFPTDTALSVIPAFVLRQAQGVRRRHPRPSSPADDSSEW